MNWTETRQRLIECGIAAERLPQKWQPDIDLSGANLSGADLSWANLGGADLCWAGLGGADLSGAVLSRADGPFTTGYFGRHHAIAAGGYIAIGCERHSYTEWLEQAEKIGRRYEYSAAEISDYVAWIRLAVARQQLVEAEIEAARAGKATPPAA